MNEYLTCSYCYTPLLLEVPYEKSLFNNQVFPVIIQFLLLATLF